jgi:hypothetical protein
MGLLDNFKLGRDNNTEESFSLATNNLNLLTIQPAVTFNQTEWVFQFDDEEPRVFATQQVEPSLTITLNNTNNASIEFTNNNRRFKIFARERQQ